MVFFPWHELRVSCVRGQRTRNSRNSNQQNYMQVRPVGALTRPFLRELKLDRHPVSASAINGVSLIQYPESSVWLSRQYLCVYFVRLAASSDSETIVAMSFEIAITQQQRNKWLSRDTL